MGFAVKIDPDPTGSAPDASDLEYGTLLGGDEGQSTTATGIALDSGGLAYVTGDTNAATYPVTPGAVNDAPDSPSFDNTFITKFTPTQIIDGSPLNIAVDPTGHLSVSIDGQPGEEIELGGGGLGRAGLTLFYTAVNGLPEGVFGNGFNQFVPVDRPKLQINGSTFELTTKYQADDSSFASADVVVTETDTYINGELGFTTEYSLHNPIGGNPAPFAAMVAGDMVTAGEDTGVGAFDSTAPRFLASLSDPYQTGDGLLEVTRGISSKALTSRPSRRAT